MKRTGPLLLLVGVLLLWQPAKALAGMASPITDVTVETWLATGLREVAIARLQNLSFFLLGFFVSAFCIQLLWNYLAKEWTFLPRLSFFRAAGFVFLWCLLFVVVLTMIAGARELMTPGAWEQNGITYRLKQVPEAVDVESLETRRRDNVKLLKAALWDYAAKHEGRLPDNLGEAGIARDAQRVPDGSRMAYIFVKGLKAAQGDSPLLLEPDIFASGRFVLYSSGKIRLSTSAGNETASAQVQP